MIFFIIHNNDLKMYVIINLFWKQALIAKIKLKKANFHLHDNRKLRILLLKNVSPNRYRIFLSLKQYQLHLTVQTTEVPPPISVTKNKMPYLNFYN